MRDDYTTIDRSLSTLSMNHRTQRHCTYRIIRQVQSSFVSCQDTILLDYISISIVDLHIDRRTGTLRIDPNNNRMYSFTIDCRIQSDFIQEIHVSIVYVQ
jgi:hypothetical protein